MINWQGWKYCYCIWLHNNKVRLFLIYFGDAVLDLSVVNSSQDGQMIQGNRTDTAVLCFSCNRVLFGPSNSFKTHQEHFKRPSFGPFKIRVDLYFFFDLCASAAGKVDYVVKLFLCLSVLMWSVIWGLHMISLWKKITWISMMSGSQTWLPSKIDGSVDHSGEPLLWHFWIAPRHTLWYYDNCL